jgi:hypothetical protein
MHPPFLGVCEVLQVHKFNLQHYLFTIINVGNDKPSNPSEKMVACSVLLPLIPQSFFHNLLFLLPKNDHTIPSKNYYFGV